MAKSSNPADAHRKMLRAKEVKKNKEARKSAREVAVVKKDTRSLEADIRTLTAKAQKAPLSAAEKAELDAARTELAKVTKAKTEYVEAHPESRKIVFPERAVVAGNAEASGSIDSGYGLYLKDGKLRNPERSYYYDPVFNPFGAPPPGMPYRQREPTEEEKAAAYQRQMEMMQPLPPAVEEESEDDEDEDDDFAMPEGPPPNPDEDDSSDSSSDDDDIAMPAGPPPPRPGLLPATNTARINIARPSNPMPPQRFHPQPFHPDPHMRHGQYPPNQRFAPPPPGLGPRNDGFRPHNTFNLPPRPQTTTQDPLSDSAAKPTFQAFQANRSNPLPPSSLPPPPPTSDSSASGIPSLHSRAPANAIISAAPQLRDLKAEATAFLPSHMRKKRPNPSAGTGGAAAKLGRIDAAPRKEGEEKGEGRASLMGALSGVGIGPVMPSATEKGGQGKEDYERFKREMGEFL